MTRTTFWLRTGCCIIWALIVLGALRSEPLWAEVVGDQYDLTGRWCGPWGCTASLPKLLAWQIPMTLIYVPAAWLLVRNVRLIQRWSGWLALATAVGTAAWLAGWAIYTASIGRFFLAGDVFRYLVFASIAGTSVVIPLLLASATCLLAGRGLPQLRSDADGGAVAEVPEDFSNVVVPHVDTAT